MLCRACLQAVPPARQLASVSRAAVVRRLTTTHNTSRSRPSANALLITRPLARLYIYSPLRPYSSASAAQKVPSSTPVPSSPEKPDFLDDAESRIWDLLTQEFTPTELSVRDISGGCGSMYGIELSSDKFRGANMLKQQRMVNAVLGDMMKDWHGVQLKTRVPEK